MPDWPRVSVIIVNMDGRRHLAPCLESLTKLDYPADHVKVILVDNGSRDDSVPYVRRNFPQVRVIRNEHNEGFAGANNQGAQAAKSRYVAFLNNDMRVHPAWLKELVTAARSAGDVAAVGGKILSWDGNAVDFEGSALNFYGMGFQPHDDPLPENQLSEILFGCGGSLLVDRQVFMDVGGFDQEFFAYFEDVDLGWRLWLLGHRVLYAPHALTYHRGHGTSSRMPASQIAVLYERNALYTIIKNYDDLNLQRVLPAALLLLTRRTMIFGRLDKRHFRMPRSVSSGPAPINSSQQLMLSTTKVSLRGIIQGFGQFVRDSGLWAAITEATRLALVSGHQKSGLLLRSKATLVPRQALAHLVAADDVIDAIPSLMEKRARIQAQRKRSDAEILPLFNVPFQPHPPFEQYIAVQKTLTHIFQIDKMFVEEEPAS